MKLRTVLLPAVTATLTCRPDGPVLPKPLNLSSSSAFQHAASYLNKTLSSALNGTIQAGWPVDNVSFSLAVVSADQRDAGVPIWEYHHRAKNNVNGTKVVTRDSQYLIGSISKVLSDYVLLTSGVDPDAKVTKYLPQLKGESKIQWEDVTLRMLGSQLSGSPTNYGFSEYYFLKDMFLENGFPAINKSDYPPCGVIALSGACTKDQLFAGMRKSYPVIAPMERPSYSNIAFVLLILALENATGRNFTQMVHDAYTPFGMVDTFPSPGNDSKAVIPPGESSWGSDYGFNAPDGGLVSTLADLSRFTHRLLARSLNLTATQTRQWLKPVAYSGASSAVGEPWEIFRSSSFTPEHPHPVTLFGKGGGAQLYSSQMYVVEEYGVGLLMLSAGNTAASTYLYSALIAAFLPAVDEASRVYAKEQYARTFACNGVNATFALDNDSLVIKGIERDGKDVYKGLSAIWGVTMGQYTSSFGKTIRLFPQDLDANSTLDGRTVVKEVWRLWPEFGAESKSDMPGAKLSYEDCLTWSLGDWVHYGGEPLDRVVFYKQHDKVVGFEMPFLRSGVLRPVD